MFLADQLADLVEHLAVANQRRHITARPSSYLFRIGQRDARHPERDRSDGLAKSFSGALAQLGERLICIQEVIGSIPIGSTIARRRRPTAMRMGR